MEWHPVANLCSFRMSNLKNGPISCHYNLKALSHVNDSVSHVEFKKWPCCRPVEIRGQGPHICVLSKSEGKSSFFGFTRMK